MKKFYITPNASSKHGYDFIIDDDGIRTTIELTRKTGDGYIHLPQEYHETLNRKLLKFSDFEGKGEYEITRRDGRLINSTSVSTTPKAPSKGLEEYLDNDDKVLYLALIEKAMKNKKRMELMAEIERLSAEIADMEAQA